MRYVVVPRAVQPKTIQGKPYTETADGETKPTPMAPITLHAFLLRFVINEVNVTAREGGQQKVTPKMGEGYAGMKAIRKLDRLFENTKPGDVVAVEDADWSRVKGIIEELSFSPPHFGSQLEALADAWMRAPESKEEADKVAADLAATAPPPPLAAV